MRPESAGSRWETLQASRALFPKSGPSPTAEWRAARSAVVLAAGGEIRINPTTDDRPFQALEPSLPLCLGSIRSSTVCVRPIENRVMKLCDVLAHRLRAVRLEVRESGHECGSFGAGDGQKEGSVEAWAAAQAGRASVLHPRDPGVGGVEALACLRFADVNRSAVVVLIDDALEAFAKVKGFLPPPKR
jgi:hypothetical protein